MKANFARELREFVACIFWVLHCPMSSYRGNADMEKQNLSIIWPTSWADRLRSDWQCRSQGSTLADSCYRGGGLKWL